MPSDQPSTVIAITSNDIRLISLGLYQLHPNHEVEPPAAHTALTKRLGAAEKVLKDRAWLREAEHALLDSKDDARGIMGRPRADEDVRVRLQAQDLQLALTGLQAFLERENPKTDPFSKAEPKPLIDPPEQVRPLLRRLQQAIEVCERQRTLPDRELALLN